MYEILVYLFENYEHPATFPEKRTLFRKLAAIGFENTDIQEALSWLSKLQLISKKNLIFSSPKSFRVFDKKEAKYFNSECQNYFFFLESAEAIDAKSRELIIELALALSDHSLTIDKLKIITLIALWADNKIPDTLILTELLTDQISTFH